MNILFLGDSYTSGESNNFYGFPQMLQERLDNNSYKITNLGVSGTCMGEYSLYPVDGSSLISVLLHNPDVVGGADIIFLGYGINDASAAACKNIKEQQVHIQFIKCLDLIKQLNPHCLVCFLSFTSKAVILKLLECQKAYLTEDYFGNTTITFSPKRWLTTYYTLINDTIRHRCQTLDIVDNVNFFDTYLSEDHIHPTQEGYQYIANRIYDYLNMQGLLK